ncbi:MAG TPA: undecaprenyl diphosphate synthase family protein [Methanocella sp.]|uniref:undecaprenyl diphosphate synthase family protein n=1 Tax=Methanocella sp. TaxID=2052833 RepID=UPI002C6011C8|nr:undecaprenyl diphosphate synthase family protein [Methanocella sp.]HTY90528.1 undecaprenyl diphosphate synthase family protein [Methanocella sp.]
MLVRQLAYKIYEMSLARGIRQSPVPRCIALVISDGDLIDKPSLNKLLQLIEWCGELGIHEASIYVSVTDPGAVSKLAECIHDVFKDAGFPGKIVSPGGIAQIGGDRPCTVSVSIGYGGKHELTNALRAVMEDVQEGRVAPDSIDEQAIDSRLIFKCEPDLFIRTGEARLTDFLIWQAVYSELYFTDVNWEDFRKIDLLRAIRDYQYRQRRYGT